MEKERLADFVKKAIKEFNKYRSPEAVAELVDTRPDGFTVKFSGSFCMTCGFYDYFDDLAVILEGLGVKSKVESVKENENGAVVRFSLKEKA